MVFLMHRSVLEAEKAKLGTHWTGSDSMTTTTSSPSSRESALQATATGDLAFSLPLEHSVLAPSTARHAARPILESWGLAGDQVYDILLVISELVTNAITHALPPVLLRLCAAAGDMGQIRVHVKDGGPRPAAHAAGWTATRSEDEHGRGEAIITTLTHHAGADCDSDGLIDHWAALDAV
ncbi:ATP-binding protein [Streptomyces sp. NPDC004787]|uniref:ATP-binding protein n=1 Tax=Streptomyces sp. NPDC004787 TaxID=3154291 RepID=UPI0033B76DE8